MKADVSLHTEMVERFARKKMISFAVPILIFAYFVYIFVAFDMAGLKERARLDNAVTLISDSYSYKTHVTQPNRGSGQLIVAIEGERKGKYSENIYPEWVDVQEAETVITLRLGHEVVLSGKTLSYEIPGDGLVTITPKNSGIECTRPEGELPIWINASRTRVSIKTEGGRLAVTKSKIEIFRYFMGWELFWFTLDSDYSGKSVGEVLSLALSSDRVNPEYSNIAGIWKDFWGNKMWRHSDVIWAIFETLLMAFLGTVGGALLALPLAFLSAKNFSPRVLVRFGVRRVFDFLRGVDSLIWTIILSRAFGPGPLTGSLAILLTDTGTFGKLFSEALENVDDKQIEGIQSTGAKPLQRYRFGVIPQIMPVLLSQILYYMESNTRSATVVGAIVGGGIGLLLTQAIITGKDWEEVTYYIGLIVLMVMLMDSLSGWLRRKLIGQVE